MYTAGDAGYHSDDDRWCTLQVTLGITVLLSYSVFMLLVTDNMPPTSEYIPLIGQLVNESFYPSVIRTGLSSFISVFSSFTYCPKSFIRA